MRRILSKFLIVSLLLSMVSSGLTVFAEAEGEMAEGANGWRTASGSNTIAPDLEDDDIYDEDMVGGIHDEIATYTNASPSIPVHDHIYDQKTFYSPQCLEAVTNTFQCRYCEDSYERVTGAAGHVKAEFPFGKQDRCTWDAAFIEMCTRCGIVTKDLITKPPVHGKEYELVSVGQPQCGPYRYDTYRCGTCDNTGQVKRYTEENQECDYEVSPTSEIPSTCVVRGYKEFACKTAKHPETNKYVMLDYLAHSVVNDACTGCNQTQAQLDGDFTYTVRFVSTIDWGNTGSIYKEIQLRKDEAFTVPGDVIEGVYCSYYGAEDGFYGGRRLVSGEVYKNLTNTDGGIVTVFPQGIPQVSKTYKAPALYVKMLWNNQGYMDHKFISLGREPVELTDEAILALVREEIEDKRDNKAQSILEAWEMYVDPGTMSELSPDSNSSYRPFNSKHVLSDNGIAVTMNLKASGTPELPAPKTKIKLVAKYPGGETEGIVMKSHQETVVSSVDLLHNILSNQQKELSKYQVTGYEILKFDGTPYGSGRSIAEYPTIIDALFKDSMVKLIYDYRGGSVQVDTNHGEFKTYDQEYFKVELPAGLIDPASLSAINIKIADIIRKGYTFDGIMLDTQEPWEPGYEQYEGRWYKPLNRDTLADTFVVSGDSYLIPKWKPVKINLTIDWNHTEVTADNLHWELDYGSYVPKFYPAVLDGYKIAGYFSEKDGTGEALGTKVLFEDSVFYAQWVKDDVELPSPEDPDPEGPGPEKPAPDKPGGGSGGGSSGGPGGGAGGGDSNHGPGVIAPEVPKETLPVPLPDPIPTEKPPIITDNTGNEVPRRLTEEELSWYIANNEVPLGYMLTEDGTLLWMGRNGSLDLPKTMDASRGQLRNLMFLLLGFAAVLMANRKKHGATEDIE